MSNTIHVFGNVTADAKYRSDNPKAPLTFTVADNHAWKDESGNWHNEPTYHRVVVFRGGLADYLKERAVRGAYVSLRGRLTHNRYTAEGEARERVEPEIVLGRDAIIDILDPPRS